MVWRISRGREFQITGAFRENARSPILGPFLIIDDNQFDFEDHFPETNLVIVEDGFYLEGFAKEHFEEAALKIRKQLQLSS